MNDPSRSLDSPVQMLLNRLQVVRKYGKGWRAACPAHEGKSKSSLSIVEGDDGRVLMHCFGGCAPLEILKVCGLEMADLFPRRITHNATPEERRHLRELAKQSHWKAALEVLDHESKVIWVAAAQIRNGEPLNDTDIGRLDLALARIMDAKGVLHGR